MNIIDISDRAFKNIEWGTQNEEIHLNMVGKLVACPETGVADFLDYENTCKGILSTRKRTPLNHWERLSSELAGAMVCAMVYQNNSRTQIRTFPFIQHFYRFLLKNHLYLTAEYAHEPKRVDKFCKHLEKTLCFPIHVPYTIHIGDKKVTVTEELWNKTYKDTVMHPYIRKCVKEYLHCKPLERRDILLQLIDGMEQYFKELRKE